MRWSILLICPFLFISSILRSQEIIEIPDTGWSLWPDTAASWEEDELFLPDDVNLSELPVNPPTGGWQVLRENPGKIITLPATVEQYFWGKFGYRPYQDEYYFEKDDLQVKNGNYKGVSWWWRDFTIPESLEGKRITLQLRGARLRVEIYVNEILVGYHIIAETSYQCDISNAIHTGQKNQLAIRITNPGGEMDWMDTKLHNWGSYKFHMGHGFGGIDRGLYLTTHELIFFKDFSVLNTPEIKTVEFHGIIGNETTEPFQGELTFAIIHPKTGEKLISRQKNIKIKALSDYFFKEPLSYQAAEVWNVEQPNLYKALASIEGRVSSHQKIIRQENSRIFGFRWFEADGIGDNAVLRLNGQRIRLISAISWGFWGLNGLWPSPQLAEREVFAAKAFGMNCLQFHRNIGRTEVLDAQDRLGLLRFMEPGGGQSALGDSFSLYAKFPDKLIDTSGNNGEPGTFAEKYMEEKIIRMIRDHRSHPSLIMYCIQNEIHPDLRNPRIYHLLKKMHREDPSRIVILKSGIPPRNQAWMQPYDNTVYIDRGDGYSGWWDQHTVGGPGVWQDDMYKDSLNFTHASVNDSEIVMWGEMLGAAVPDNHPRMIGEIISSGGNSYDINDHNEILDAYDQFLDRWGFRQAFPTTERLFLDIGDKCYDFWGRVIETARLSDANDFLVISGWESTSMENHSGLVDNLRGFKGNPNLLKTRLAPLRPVIKPKSQVVALGKRDTCDLYLLNETTQPHSENISFSLISPRGNINKLGQLRAPQWREDQFVYPIKYGWSSPILEEEGWYTFRLTVEGQPNIIAEEKILVVNPDPKSNLSATVGILTHEPEFIKILQTFSGIQAEPYREEEQYDLIIASTRLLHGWRSEVDSNREIAGTEDDILYHTESWGYWRNLEYIFTNLPAGEAKVTFRLAEVTLKNPGDRIMNVAINGDTVLKDLDITAITGGPNIALDTVFFINTMDGTIKITIPKLTVNYAKFSALKIEAGDTIVAINCGGQKPYRDKQGLLWDIYGQKINLGY